MSCTGRYAEAWQYSSYVCGGNLVTGLDEGGGVGLAYLTDNQVDFLKAGFMPNEGMILYNTTTNLSGIITAVTHHTMTATGVLWTNGQAYRAVSISAQEKSTIENYLNLAAGDIQIALQSIDACNCTLSAAGANYLAHLNILIALFYYNCPCGSPQLTPDEKRIYMEQVNTALDRIKTGEFDVCQGATGSNYPAWGIIQTGQTPFAATEIIIKQLQRIP